MKTALKKPHHCKLPGCNLLVPPGYRNYCSDAHRKYAWKKRNWKKYLAWQREYMKKKKDNIISLQ